MSKTQRVQILRVDAEVSIDAEEGCLGLISPLSRGFGQAPSARGASS